MAIRGPTPQEPNELAIKGELTLAQRELGLAGSSSQPEPLASGEIETPARLVGHGRAVFEYLAGELANRQVLSAQDLVALEILAESVHIYRLAQEAIAEHGLTERTAEGRRIPAPEVNIARQQWSIINSLLAQFGLTPATRANTRGAGLGEGSGDILEGILG